MEPREVRDRSHLFTVRIWSEPVDERSAEWRGSVTLVASGHTRYFRDWSTLIAHLRDLLPAADDT